MALADLFRGKTYDDFLLRPQKGVVGSRQSVSLASVLTRQIPLELPIVSANMDSVTSGAMARTMALAGGLGIVHRAMPIEAQAREVKRVKRSHGHVVEHPLSLPRTATIREARAFTKRHSITGILIEQTAGSELLAGLLSNRDMPWSAGHEDDAIDRFMTPVERLVTAPPGIKPEEAERILFEHRIEKLPLVDTERRIRGLITKSDLILARKQPESSKDAKGRLRVGAAIGARGDFLERAAELIDAGVDVLVIDIAHGHSEVMEQAIEAFRRRCGETPLVCGNVGTREGAQFLKERGADAVKVGIGPGRGCRTRLETAAGVPQLQAIAESWDVLRDEIPIIADGGIKDDKDVFLALACGASSVMLGSMLSGTDEAPGTVLEDPATRQKHKIYRGMTSPEAVFEALYDPTPEDIEAALQTPAEGQEMRVPYRGSVEGILGRIAGHLRSAVSYAGARSLNEARARVLADPARYLIPLSEPSRRESYDR